jgi:hypothetical protein
MRVDQRELQRLGEGGEAPDSLEGRAGRFLHGARALAGLAESEIRAIERRLGRRQRARPPLLVPALVALAVLLVTGSVLAIIGVWRPRLPGTDTGEAPSSHSPIARAKPRARPEVMPLAPPTLVAPAVERPVALPAPSPAQREPAPRRISRVEPTPPVAPALAAAPPPEGALSVEARSLADALARWRRDGKAEHALALLAEHDRRFPRGALGIEAKVARAEILLGLSRKPQALAVLDSLTLGSLPRARELATLRGELRAQAGRCSDARVDLERVLSITKDDELGKRAARALAICP